MPLPSNRRVLAAGYVLVGAGWAQYCYQRNLRDAMRSRNPGIHWCRLRAACEEVSPGLYTCSDARLTDSDKRHVSTVAVVMGLHWPISMALEAPYALNELFSRKPK